MGVVQKLKWVWYVHEWGHTRAEVHSGQRTAMEPLLSSTVASRDSHLHGGIQRFSPPRWRPEILSSTVASRDWTFIRLSWQIPSSAKFSRWPRTQCLYFLNMPISNYIFPCHLCLLYKNAIYDIDVFSSNIYLKSPKIIAIIISNSVIHIWPFHCSLFLLVP